MGFNQRLNQIISFIVNFNEVDQVPFNLSSHEINQTLKLWTDWFCLVDTVGTGLLEEMALESGSLPAGVGRTTPTRG